MSNILMETGDGYIKRLSGRSDRPALIEQYKLLKLNTFRHRKQAAICCCIPSFEMY